MLQTFLQIGYLCKTHGIFSTSLCEKRPIHFNTPVFLTSLTYQSYNRCDTMRLKSIPMDKDTSLFYFLSSFFFSFLFFLVVSLLTNLLLAICLFFSLID